MMCLRYIDIKMSITIIFLPEHNFLIFHEIFGYPLTQISMKQLAHNLSHILYRDPEA